MSNQVHAIAALAFLVSSPVWSQEAIRNRSVRIIEEGTPIESIIPRNEPARPPAKVQSTTAAPEGTTSAAAKVSPAPGANSPRAESPPSKPNMTVPVLTAEDRASQNEAGLKLELTPGTEIAVGSQMSVTVTTQKPGYLIVIDVDSEGHLSQIYPNTHSLATKEGALPSANLIQKGKPRIIPDPKERSTFQFVAAPPVGVGMLVAILSDTPVQVIDLPDIPSLMAGQKPALEYVRETTRQLKILPSSDREGIRDPKWSFASQFYMIK